MMGISIFFTILLIIEDKRLNGILNNVSFEEKTEKIDEENPKKIENEKEHENENLLKQEE